MRCSWQSKRLASAQPLLGSHLHSVRWRHTAAATGTSRPQSTTSQVLTAKQQAAWLGADVQHRGSVLVLRAGVGGRSVTGIDGRFAL